MNEKFFADLLSPNAAKWSAGVSFDRSNPLPLDQWSVFQNKTKAEEYVSSNDKAYPGQVIAYADTNGEMIACVVSQNAEATALVLKQIGIIPTGDGHSIEVTADGVISLKGLQNATDKLLPRANKVIDVEADPENGIEEQSHMELEWVSVDAVV
jgi:hypothetical protein